MLSSGTVLFSAATVVTISRVSYLLRRRCPRTASAPVSAFSASSSPSDINKAVRLMNCNNEKAPSYILMTNFYKAQLESSWRQKKKRTVISSSGYREARAKSMDTSDTLFIVAARRMLSAFYAVTGRLPLRRTSV